MRNVYKTEMQLPPIIKPTWQKNEKLNPVIIAISTALRGEVKQIRSARSYLCSALKH